MSRKSSMKNRPGKLVATASGHFWNWTNEGTERVLHLNGTIAEESWFADEITPEMFRQELMAGSGPVTVWINSPGGDTVSAAQIYNMLMDYPYDVTVKIDGIAASAASVIAMAGTTVLMSPVSCMMIHNPATIAAGDHTEMEKAIAILETVKDSIINAYEIKTGLPREEISRMMEEETWFDANKAVEMGFADGILQRAEIASVSEQKSPVLYSQRKANQALVNKLAETAGIPAGPLYERLNRLKG